MYLHVNQLVQILVGIQKNIEIIIKYRRVFFMTDAGQNIFGVFLRVVGQTDLLHAGEIFL